MAKGYAQLPKYLSAKETMELMKEIIPMGISDKSPVVRAAMTEAAQAAIAEHGEVYRRYNTYFSRTMIVSSSTFRPCLLS